ncbi:hypothetical protein Tco_1259838 [Tanacetum coccineum]
MPPKRTTIPMTDAAIKSSRNGDDSHDSRSGGRRHVHTTWLTQWFEKMESVFHISNCTVACQIKFAACTLLGSALTWWNSHVKTISHDAAYGMSWKSLIKMLTDNYTQHFQELALMCGRMFPEESDQVEKYVGGLLDMIQGSVMASKPKIMQEAIEFANELMDQKIRTFIERQAKNKRKLDNNSSDNSTQQPPFKRQNVAKAYSVGPSEKKEYAGTLPLCNKCKLHHNGPCTEWFSELKNRNNENKAGGTEARGMANALGGGETDQEPNNIEDDINA